MAKLKVFLILLVLILAAGFYGRSHIINMMMPADSRPGDIEFAVDSVSVEGFETIAAELEGQFSVNFKHVEIFRDGGILAYEGPSTCLRCHQQIEFECTIDGSPETVDLWDNLLTSAHYRFYTEEHDNIYGFNGDMVGNFKMGKINRPCPKPGSFAMTAWAEIVVLESGDTLSEGCGQCHIGGQYQAPLGEMMPGYVTLQKEKDAIDCLICHAQAYDMNRKEVVVDDNGRARWAQDRTMMAAMSVTTTTAQTCLRCHQHNMGGDVYIDSLDESYHQSLVHTGYTRPRIKHPGSKRGTPYTPSWDVHAAAGMDCTECHATEGHYIARGTHTTTLMANDLPDYEIECETCHSDEPHTEDVPGYATYNQHNARIACQTCHIPSLHEDNTTMRDFATPEFHEHPGIYVYTDTEKKTEAGEAFRYVWWNGDATFLGNAIGDNPNGKNLFRFYDPQHVWPEYMSYDYGAWYEEKMRPIAQAGRPSKVYPMKVYNGREHIDLQNMGPFGGMFIPYSLPTYYTTGDPGKAAQVEMDKSMMGMMYGFMFKYYMMDRFMSYMDVDGWNTEPYEDVKELRNVDPRWIPMDASMEISHAIRRDGALTCSNCHSPDGVMDWELLGYDQTEIDKYTLPSLEE